jgi:cupin 2 domain-containing protein
MDSVIFAWAPQRIDMKSANIYHGIPADLPDEIAESLLSQTNLRVERIVSRGHRSLPDFWYDQEEHEWILVLTGSARLQLAESGELVSLHPGDYLEIPAHTRHRVDWTDPSQDTIWLAIFFTPEVRNEFSRLDP